MSFQTEYAKLQALYEGYKAWRLLKADNASLIIAFLSTLFHDQTEVPYANARSLLDIHLTQLRDDGLWDAETSAMVYLNQWISAGWLRELDNNLSLTDACDTVIRFARTLDQRESATTASHLRIVQDAVRDLAIALSPDVEQRVTRLQHRRQEIDLEIEALQKGFIKTLDEYEQRERIREIYHLASVLTADFRWMEDQIRELDRDLRVQIIGGESGRGQILESLLRQEAMLARTDSGSAFDSFFTLLCQQERNLEFKEQVSHILSQPAAQYLTPRQFQYLNHLLQELLTESERVLKVRRRTEESLRSYIESGAYSEKRSVDRWLTQLERIAIAIREQEVDPRRTLTLTLDTGSPSLFTIDAIILNQPEQAMNTDSIEEHDGSGLPNPSILKHMDVVALEIVAGRMRRTLEEHGPLTIAQIGEVTAISRGIEELVAMVRVAKRHQAHELPGRERLIIQDRDGTRLEADIPKMLLSAAMFEPSAQDTV